MVMVGMDTLTLLYIYHVFSSMVIIIHLDVTCNTSVTATSSLKAT